MAINERTWFTFRRQGAALPLRSYCTNLCDILGLENDGGAALRDIAAVAEHELGMTSRLGYPQNIDGLENETFPPAYAAVTGALLYANRNFTENSLFESILQRFFR